MVDSNMVFSMLIVDSDLILHTSTYLDMNLNLYKIGPGKQFEMIVAVWEIVMPVETWFTREK